MQWRNIPSLLPHRPVVHVLGGTCVRVCMCLGVEGGFARPSHSTHTAFRSPFGSWRLLVENWWIVYYKVIEQEMVQNTTTCPELYLPVCKSPPIAHDKYSPTVRWTPQERTADSDVPT